MSAYTQNLERELWKNTEVMGHWVRPPIFLVCSVRQFWSKMGLFITLRNAIPEMWPTTVDQQTMCLYPVADNCRSTDYAFISPCWALTNLLFPLHILSLMSSVSSPSAEAESPSLACYTPMHIKDSFSKNVSFRNWLHHYQRNVCNV